MNLKQKAEYAAQHLRGIADHELSPIAERKAMLTKLYEDAVAGLRIASDRETKARADAAAADKLKAAKAQAKSDVEVPGASARKSSKPSKSKSKSKSH